MLSATVVLVLCTLLAFASAQFKSPVRGVHCSRNQAINKITVYEEGAIESECGPIPCGSTGECSDDVGTNCKAETEIYSGMRWAKNGQSLMLRCCAINVPGKTYIGTDLVPLGSFYTGGLVPKKDMYANGGPEYDYVANVRMEQLGLRVWVYRILCPNVTSAAPVGGGFTTQPAAGQFVDEDKSRTVAQESHRASLLKHLAEQQQQRQQLPQSLPPMEVAPSMDEESVQLPTNPLQYRPARVMAARQRDSPVPAAQRVL